MERRFNDSIVDMLVAQIEEEEEDEVEVDESEETAEVEKKATEEEAEQPLPLPESLLQSYDATSRFKGGNWFELIKNAHISLIGVGGIGSSTALALARAGVGNLDLYDGDRVDESNMAGQMYREDDIGETKVSAISNIIKEYCPTLKGCMMEGYYHGQYMLAPITITALDSMSARKEVWEAYKEQTQSMVDKSKYLFIDGRMNAELFQVFCFRMSQEDRIKQYEEKCLFDDGLAMELPCSYKATFFIGSMIGSYITAIVKEHLHLTDDEMFGENVKFFNEIDTGIGIKVTQSELWV